MKAPTRRPAAIARAIAILAFLLAVGVVVAILRLPGSRLIAARAALFNRRIDLADFRARASLPPGRWIAQEQAPALAAVRREVLLRRPALEAWLASPRGSDAAEATAIVARLSSTNVRCSLRRDLVDKAVGLLGGTEPGCCSDFVEVFQLLASLRGLPTREVANARHNYVEYWDTGRSRWHVVDPHYGLEAVGPEGAPAGALEIAAAVLRGPDGAGPTPAITWRLVAGRAAPPAPATSSLSFSSAEAWRTLIVTERSDVVAQDAFDRHLRFLPKPAAQLVELLTGARPRWSQVHLDRLDRLPPAPSPGEAGPRASSASMPSATSPSP